MGDEQKATFEYAAEFHSLSGEILKVELSKLILTDDDLRLTGEVDPATFTLIEQEMAFNMLPQVRKPYDTATFREGINIELELMLRPSLLNAWRANGITEVEDMMREIFAQERNNLFMESEVWLLTKAVQPYIDNVETGTFSKAGFQTLWSEDARSEADPRVLVLQYLDDKGWNFDTPEDSVLRVFVGTDAGRWILLIDVDIDPQLVTCLSVFPRDIPEASRTLVAQYLSNLNYNLAFGNFEMDEDDGDLRFRTSLFFGSSGSSAEAITNLIDLNVGTMGDFYTEIEELARE